MTYKSTHDVVRRVMPLLEQLANRTIDKARLLQYLSAAAGVDWHVLEVVADSREHEERIITYRDRASGAEHSLVYPDMLGADIHDLVLTEYKRLAVDRPLTSMDERLFDYLYGRSHCDRCVYRGPTFAQIHAECYFAGHPINFEPNRPFD